MDNPFLSTNHYTAVQEYNRIVSRSRSSSDSSLHSNYSAISKNNDPPWASQHYESKFQREYMRGRDQERQLEVRRARVLGVEELRYKPAYFKEFMGQSNYQRSSQPNYQHSNSLKKGKLQIPPASNHTINRQQDFPQSMSSQSVLARERSQKQIGGYPSMKSTSSHEYNSSLLRKRNNSSDTRRSSCMETLINLNCQAGNNENYTSIADINSLHVIKSQVKKKRSSGFFVQKNFQNQPPQESIFSNQVDQSRCSSGQKIRYIIRTNGEGWSQKFVNSSSKKLVDNSSKKLMGASSKKLLQASSKKSIGSNRIEIGSIGELGGMASSRKLMEINSQYYPLPSNQRKASIKTTTKKFQKCDEINQSQSSSVEVQIPSSIFVRDRVYYRCSVGSRR